MIVGNMCVGKGLEILPTLSSLLKSCLYCSVFYFVAFGLSLSVLTAGCPQK